MGYRYIGSKDKLAQILIEFIREQCPAANSVGDLMAGTGLFSLALRKSGYRVFASDVMTYSLHHLKVLLTLNTAPAFKKITSDLSIKRKGQRNYEAILSYLNALPPQKGYFYAEYGAAGSPKNCNHSRLYFSAENAGKIDAIRNTIIDWKEKKLISNIEHSLLLHDLILAVNDVANIAGTYGHYLSHMVTRSLSPICMKPFLFEQDNNTVGHKIMQGYAEKIASKVSTDVCYIDPPYIKRQYAANYHILETIAREDCPNAVGDSGLRPWRDQYSNFCSKIKIRKSIDDIFTGLSCKHVFISYSEDGLLSKDELLNVLKKYGDLTLKEIEYKRFKSNDSKKDALLKEYIIHVCRR